MGPKELKFSKKVVFLSGEPFTLPTTSSAPIDAVNGDMYYDSSENKIKVYQNGQWVNLVSSDQTTGNVINKFTLSSTDITNQFVTLSGTPMDPTKALLDVIGGPTQDYGVDFQITGNVLSWGGLSLDGVLVVGDKLIVQFE